MICNLLTDSCLPKPGLRGNFARSRLDINWDDGLGLNMRWKRFFRVCMKPESKCRKIVIARPREFSFSRNRKLELEHGAFSSGCRKKIYRKMSTLFYTS